MLELAIVSAVAIGCAFIGHVAYDKIKESNHMSIVSVESTEALIEHMNIYNDNFEQIDEHLNELNGVFDDVFDRIEALEGLYKLSDDVEGYQ